MSPDQGDTFKSALTEAISGVGIVTLSDEQLSQLAKHYSMMCRWNQRLNLTRITDLSEAARLHYAESLFGASFIAGERTLLDIGSGAGFPAIPVAVARPDVQVSALDANQKKSLFLKEAKDELGLSNLTVVTSRLEETDWTDYELLMSRALDRAENVLPSVIERLSPRQRLILFCGPDLVAKLEREANCRSEAHAVPHSEARLIAVFSRK
jgi:16S rRNA (guanine527-N7)-methyltransferase